MSAVEETKIFGMKVLFRCDSSISMGTGHIQRCLTLADALKPLSSRIDFFCLRLPGNIAQQISARGYKVELFDSEANTLHTPAPGQLWDWVIFDNYQVHDTLETQWRPLTKKIMVIDDLANRKHDCDVLLDTNVHANNNIYKTLIPERATALIGPTFSLLRTDFKSLRPDTPPKTIQKRGLIFFGGTDPLGLLPSYYEFLLNNPLITKDYDFDFLVSSASPSLTKLKTLAPHPRLHLQIDPPSVAKVMLDAGFYIGSGGTITWERMHLGLTGVVLAVADNQIENAKNLHGLCCHEFLGKAQDLTPEQVFTSATNLLKDPKEFLLKSERCYQLVDGSGYTKLMSVLQKS